jgi:hypothetical protein
MTEYTLHSRMRRAITWVYCDPKSKMTICSFMKSKAETHFFARAAHFWRAKNVFTPAGLG